jgi:hypothetical protein
VNVKKQRFIGSPGMLALVCLFIPICASLWLGQDANWDLRNYHFYNPHAWISDRTSLDVAPAQIQTYHSPFNDLPYYLLVRAGLSSWVIAILLAVPAAVALSCLSVVARRLLPGQPMTIVCVVLVAATGAAVFPTIGTTMSEWHVYALFLAAIGLALNTIDPTPTPGESSVRWIACGLLAGLAVGLKFTAGCYALGLAGLVLTIPGQWTTRLQRVVLLAFGGLVGVAIVFGPWGVELWNRYGNPLFPYFNDVFKSTWVLPIRHSDERFVVTSVTALLTLPWRLMLESHGLVAELPLRDWRLGLGLPALAWLAFAPNPRSHTTKMAWRALLAFVVVSYCIWAEQFGIYRYAGLLEMLASLALIGWAAQVGRKWGPFAVVIAALTVVGTTVWPDWQRRPHGMPAVLADMPPLPLQSMVVIASVEPVAYIVPSLPPDVPVVSLVNNFMRPGPDASNLQLFATERVRKHHGPLWLVWNKTIPDERYFDGAPIADMMRELGFVADLRDCRPIESELDRDTLALCRLEKLPNR